MAHLLGADGVSVRFGTRQLLDAVTLGLDDGDRVGVVGPNGAGKTTLLRVLAGTQPVDSGRVTRLGRSTLGVLEQRDNAAPGQSVLDLIHGDKPEHEWASDAQIRSVHDGLLADIDLDQPADTLSGGQRRRVALAALLVSDPDLLFLDEPTNHLDVEGVDWLARHLQARYGGRGARGAARGAAPKPTGALVVVTHDRWFLDAVCSRMIEVVGDGRVDQYEGGYAAYVLARAERARQASAAADKRNNLLRKELAWLKRGAPARTSKPKFRLDAAAELIADEPEPRDSLELTRLATRRLGKDVLDVEDVSLELGGRELFDDVTWRIGPGDRYGLVGVNGAGKTTMLALLAGRRAPDAGRVKRGKTVEVAELTQDVAELADLGHLNAVQVIEREKKTISISTEGPAFMARTRVGSGGAREMSAAQLTERLGFTKERAHTPVRDLSGGERRRLQLARLLVSEPNVLLLDEPTNDLDTDTLAAVEDLLDNWPGTLIVVSHDRYLLERVCDRQWALLGDGKLIDLPGGVEQYLALRRAGIGGGPQAAAGAGAKPGGGSKPSGGSGRPAAASRPTRPVQDAQATRQARKDLQRIEKQLAKLEAEETELHHVIAENATDYAAVAKADARLQEVAAEREDLELQWLEAAEVAG